jgi:phosphonate transport system substrate-binding protein
MAAMTTWNAVSYLAPNMFGLYMAVCTALERTLGAEIVLTQANCDSLDDTLMRDSAVDLAFICGLPLVRLNRRQPGLLRVLAAPVFEHPRYGGKAVYFADFIVRTDSPAQSLGDLRGATFCYNDPGSNSGYYLPRYHLLRNGCPPEFFGRAYATGAHQQSIREVATGKADCAAIDSTVLEQAMRDTPALAAQVRVIDSTLPCPVPPLAISGRQPSTLDARLRAALFAPDSTLRAALERAHVDSYAPASLDDYQVIGEMYDAASGYTLAPPA